MTSAVVLGLGLEEFTYGHGARWMQRTYSNGAHVSCVSRGGPPVRLVWSKKPFSCRLDVTLT